ncbi:ribonucleases P/MRP protein subunit POP1-domain-containing protein [Podospora appendiculata]|uniref:Ribonucleases P/MRP protein subunit POP1-domain-containing protein n=1 Tax=Podospora appendiculata TaxID=314037 RepID=A0AAE0XL19_9PEZI|nr:ribonucleases P/MRP protein subunit POP1-domain-containing protein [Podospora appendiculata]
MDGKKPSFSGGKALEVRKRKEPPSGANGGKTQANPARASKRGKFYDARNIRSQPSDAALQDGRLDLQQFLSAREYEINALESSMRKTKAANATRVFQQVPRAMRRRTASHNVKRIPKRLRERARREQIEDNTPTVDARKRRPRTTRARIRAETAKKLDILAARKKKKQLQNSSGQADLEGKEGKATPTVHTRAPRPKIRRNTLNDPPRTKTKFSKRQINKTWLPTHLWLAKRATMTKPGQPLWRFAIPLTPTEKCYRPTHRASGQKGVVAWDMSYMSTIGLYGSTEGVERVLKALGLTQEGLWTNRGRKWRNGSRKWTGILSKQSRDSRRDIGPATIIWNPKTVGPDTLMTDASSPKKSQRQLFVRTHPSCFLELFNELLKLVKMQTPQLHVEDLRFEIGSIELTGPGSTETLLGVLQPYHDKPGSEGRHARVFGSLAGVANPSSLPKDALLAFSIRDPRLSYPPRTITIPNGSNSPALLDTLTTWPVDEDLKPFGLFSRDSRFQASRMPPQKSLNRRKGTNTPGEHLSITAVDPPIPVILLASRPATEGQVQGTWTLLAPWRCISAIWYSLIHYPLTTGGNPRLGGLDEIRQIAFEQGTPWFPGDFPGTDAGSRWELEQRKKRKQDWDRRPRGKRVEWKSLDLGAGRKGEVGDGFACDFEHLFGPSKGKIPATSETNDADAMDPSTPEDSDASPSKLATTAQIAKTSFTALLASSNLDEPPAHSIITVQLTLVTRGVANTCARIYRLPTVAPEVALPSTVADVPATEPSSSNLGSLPHDLRDQWLRKLPLRAANTNIASSRRGRQAKNGPAPPRMHPGSDLATRKLVIAQSLLTTQLPYPRPAANQSDVGGYPLCPGEEDLIGFVTSGAFSLSEGKGTAIGSISAEKALESWRGAGACEGKLCIVRNAGESVGWLARWELA